MFFADLMFALIFALVFWLVLGVIFGREKWGFPYILLFVILFSLTWIGGIWLTPIGIAVWDSYWLSFFLVALFISLLFAAITPPKGEKPIKQSESEPAAAASIIGAFFWLLMFLVFIGILIYYV